MDDLRNYNSNKSWQRIEQQLVSMQLRVSLKIACKQPQPSLGALALSMVSHQTLLRAPGPLGLWSPDPAVRNQRAIARQELMQTAIIAAGITLGVVRMTAGGVEAV